MEKGIIEKKLRRLRESKWYLIWEVFRYVLIVLLIVSLIIVGEKLGIVAKIVIFIVSSWFMLTILKKAMFDKSDKIRINDFFNPDTVTFNVFAFIILTIIFLCFLL